MANSRVKAKEVIWGGVSSDWRKLQIILLGSSVHTGQGFAWTKDTYGTNFGAL